MNIKVFTERTQDFQKFEKNEWPLADKEHYGSSLEWKEDHFYIEYWLGQELAGILHLKCLSGVAHIESLLVSQKYRSQGIGKAMVEMAEQQAKNLKAHKIYLDTGKGWKAEEFYLKMGYKVTGILEKHYNNCDFIIFTKFLD